MHLTSSIILDSFALISAGVIFWKMPIKCKPALENKYLKNLCKGAQSMGKTLKHKAGGLYFSLDDFIKFLVWGKSLKLSLAILYTMRTHEHL